MSVQGGTPWSLVQGPFPGLWSKAIPRDTSWSLVPGSFQEVLPSPVTGSVQTPVPGPANRAEGTPILNGDPPSQDKGTLPWKETKCLLHGRRYASCGQAGLSCY